MSIAAVTAASAAPEIDRLVLAVNRDGPRQHRERLLAAAAAVGLDEAGVLLTNIRPFLEAGPVPREVVRLRLRYRDAEAVDDELDDLVGRGLLTGAGDAVEATGRLTPLLEALADATADTAAALWEGREETVTRLGDTLGAVVAAVPDGFPLCSAHLALPEPGGALRLNHRLLGARFARSDAHAAAWAGHGLAAADMPPFTALWNGDTVDTPAREHLAELDLVDGDSLTAEARARRDRIEADTNDIVAPAFAAVDDPNGFLAELRSLPPLP